MKALENLKSLFAKKKEEKKLSISKEEVRNEVKPSDDPPYDYGMGILDVALRSKDFGWDSKPLTKKYILTNVKECENRVNVMGLVSAWRGTGHSEWEYLLAGVFMGIVLEALEKGEEQADITILFSRDLLASGGRKFEQEDVYNHLIKSFNIVDENDDEVYLVLSCA